MAALCLNSISFKTSALSSSFQVIAVWERNFRLPDPVTAEKMAALEKNFVNMARQQVKFGPSSVSDFTKWRVKSFTLSVSDVLQLCPPPTVCLVCCFDPRLRF